MTREVKNEDLVVGEIILPNSNLTFEIGLLEVFTRDD